MKKKPIGREFAKEEYVMAFRKLRFHEKLPDSYIKMLQAHYDAPGRKMTPTQLSDAAGYQNYNAVNLHYGYLGKMICDEIGYIPTDTSNGEPIYTCGVAWGEREEPDGEWVWTMYKNLAQAIKELEIVQ